MFRIGKSFRQRLRFDELMDSPDLTEDDLTQALVGLERINRYDFSLQSIFREIKKNIKTNQKVKILDLACARGDLLFFLSQKFMTSDNISLYGCDINPKSIRYAKIRSAEEGNKVNFFVHDAVKDRLDDTYDIIICSLFFHHLSRNEIKGLLNEMIRKSNLILISDLIRSAFTYYFSIIATRFITSSKIVHYDAPVSIRQSFTIIEIKEILDELGITNYVIKRQWPFRFKLIIKVE